MLSGRTESTAEIMGVLSSGTNPRKTVDLFSSSVERTTQRYLTYRSLTSSGEYPFAVVIEPPYLDEFFADLATYYSNKLPISAHSHIVTAPLFPYFDPSAPVLFPDRNSSEGFVLACLGAALGEVLISNIAAGEDGAPLSYAACRRSLGYVIARCNALYPDLPIGISVVQWTRLRELTGLASSEQTREVVESMQIAMGSKLSQETTSGLHQRFAAAIKSLLSVSGNDQAVEASVVSLYPSLGPILLALEGKFDDRLSVFLDSANVILQSSQGEINDSLVVGYLCNKLLPGSFDHSRILIKLFGVFPHALAWYGVFCTLSKQFDVNGFSNGLLLKLMRDVYMPFSLSQRPNCDVCLEELEVLSRARVTNELIKPIQQRVASIALLPGVDILSRFKTESETNANSTYSRTGFSDKLNDLPQAMDLLNEAIRLLSRLNVQSEPHSTDTRPSSKGRTKKRYL